MTVTFNKNYSTITINNVEIGLSKEQYKLLYYISHSNKIVSKDELKMVLKDKWRSDDCVKNTICTINSLMKEHIGRRIIFNKREVGYYVKKSLQVLEL